jgi:DNA-binding transcriptional LysR family regulator
MKFDQLTAFHKIVEKGGFTKAANALFISQSAVSQQIKALEHSLGCILFDRKSRKNLLTSDGKLLFEYSKRIFNIYEEVTSVFNSKSHEKKGKVAFASTRSVGTNILPKTIAHFINMNPRVELYFRLGNSYRVLDLLYEEKIDFGIAKRMSTPGGIKKFLIHQDELIAISSPNHYLSKKKKVSASDIVNSQFVWREKGTQTREVVTEWFKKNTGNNYPSESVVLEQMEAAKKIVAEGYGVAFLPKIAVEKELKSGSLSQLDLIDFSHTLDSYFYFFENKPFTKATLGLLRLFSNIESFSDSINLKNLLA